MNGKRFQYRVHWKTRGEKKPATADYLAPSLLELMRVVGRAEDVATETCDFIYVHQIDERGIPQEVFAYEKDSTLPGLVAEEEEEDENLKKVVSIVEAGLKKAAAERERAQKPHIKLTHDKTERARPFVRAAYGRYTAYEAS